MYLGTKEKFLRELEKYGYYKTCHFILALKGWSDISQDARYPRGVRWEYTKRLVPITDAELRNGSVFLKAERKRGKTGKSADKDKIAQLFAQADNAPVFVEYGGKVRMVCGVRGAGAPIDEFYFDAFSTARDDAWARRNYK